jgi:hypothetical protein
MHDEMFSSDDERDFGRRVVTARCRGCDAEIGEFYNDFVQVCILLGSPGIAMSQRHVSFRREALQSCHDLDQSTPLRDLL